MLYLVLILSCLLPSIAAEFRHEGHVLPWYKGDDEAQDQTTMDASRPQTPPFSNCQHMNNVKKPPHGDLNTLTGLNREVMDTLYSR